jgi:hypothetical protein
MKVGFIIHFAVFVERAAPVFVLGVVSVAAVAA